MVCTQCTSAERCESSRRTDRRWATVRLFVDEAQEKYGKHHAILWFFHPKRYLSRSDVCNVKLCILICIWNAVSKAERKPCAAHLVCALKIQWKLSNACLPLVFSFHFSFIRLILFRCCVCWLCFGLFAKHISTMAWKRAQCFPFDVCTCETLALARLYAHCEFTSEHGVQCATNTRRCVYVRKLKSQTVWRIWCFVCYVSFESFFLHVFASVFVFVAVVVVSHTVFFIFSLSCRFQYLERVHLMPVMLMCADICMNA